MLLSVFLQFAQRPSIPLGKGDAELLYSAEQRGFVDAQFPGSCQAIVSVGYRVKSRQGTQFRQWATQVLRDHIVKGYTLNEHRFREQTEKLADMRRTVELLARTLANRELVSETGKDILRVITDYTHALTLLDRYDHGNLTIEDTTR